jgi:hypothetical protein
MAAQEHLWTITVAGGEGDEAKVKVNEHAPLHQLLEKGVKELYGDTAKASDYDLVIDGVTQTDPKKKLSEAGLHDGSTVTILSKDVSRG